MSTERKGPRTIKFVGRGKLNGKRELGAGMQADGWRDWAGHWRRRWGHTEEEVVTSNTSKGQHSVIATKEIAPTLSPAKTSFRTRRWGARLLVRSRSGSTTEQLRQTNVKNVVRHEHGGYGPLAHNCWITRGHMQAPPNKQRV